MTRPGKSQWDFGELFPTVPTRKVLSVSELTSQVRRLLEKQIGLVWVSGEITNLKIQTSGHIYFTLKDTGAQLSCVLVRNEPQIDRSLLQDGRKLILRGDLTVYEVRGQYQLRVAALELQGVGALQAAFEKLKQKLNAEGLFAAERKRVLPRYPWRIGLVTSPTGAAIRDVLHVIKRRNPGLEIILSACRVQGTGAASEIANAIRQLNELNRKCRKGEAPPHLPRTGLDLILVTRGGGSLEDLWAFNEEIVARAIFHSELPVVSAVGHEIDFTISDFVADVRAATPSAAAEIITEGVFSSCQFVSDSRIRLGQLVRQQLEDKRFRQQQLLQRLARLHPRRRVEDRLQWLDELQNRMSRGLKQRVRHARRTWQSLSDRLARVRPALVLKQRKVLLAQTQQRLREDLHHGLRELQNRLGNSTSRLRLLGPEQVLARGYSITTDAQTGAVVRDAAQLKTGQRLKSRFQKGDITSRVEE